MLWNTSAVRQKTNKTISKQIKTKQKEHFSENFYLTDMYLWDRQNLLCKYSHIETSFVSILEHFHGMPCSLLPKIPLDFSNHYSYSSYTCEMTSLWWTEYSSPGHAFVWKENMDKDFLKIIFTVTASALVSCRSWAREKRLQWWDH